MERIFEIPGIGVDEDAINREIQERISEKEKNGVYDCFNLSEDLRMDFLDIQGDAEFLVYYLRVIKKTWAIDINDFEMTGNQGIKGFFEVRLKKIIWKLLKFYTYRLFSQQIEFNSQIKNTLIAIEKEYSARISRIESEINQIKNRKP